MPSGLRMQNPSYWEAYPNRSKVFSFTLFLPVSLQIHAVQKILQPLPIATEDEGKVEYFNDFLA